MHLICVWNMIKQGKPLQTRYERTYIYNRKNASLNYRKFDLEGDLMGVPHTWYLSVQSFITLLKLIWGVYDIVAMNEWKKKCVGLHMTWVSKHTVVAQYHATTIQNVWLWQSRHDGSQWWVENSSGCDHDTRTRQLNAHQLNAKRSSDSWSNAIHLPRGRYH